MELLDKNGRTEEEFLRTYRHDAYPHPALTADLALFCADELLLIRRGGHPCLGMWALPGGFVEPNETLENAAARELFEETCVEGVEPAFLAMFTEPGRDKRGWVVTGLFAAEAEKKPAAKASDDARDAAWFAVSYEKTDGRISFSLTSEKAKLGAVCGYTVKRTPFGEQLSVTLIENDGLAFDHAKLIAAALLRRLS